jgi:hypothetical protein
MHKVTLKDKLAVYDTLDRLKSKFKSLIFALSAGYMLHIVLKCVLSLVSAEYTPLNTFELAILWIICS